MSLRDVGVKYNTRKLGGQPFWALKGVSFDLNRGETLGIIGRNGAGKSTLMRVLAGIIAPDRGELLQDRLRVQLLALQVGFIKDLTGRENAIMSGILLGMRRRDVEAMIPDIIEFSQLEKFIDQPVRSYSSGMRARLGFAIAKNANPDVLLIDEALGVGDRDFKVKTREVIVNRIKSDETVVLVSHQEETVRQFCDRVVWIEGGETRMQGQTEEVLEQYGQAPSARKASRTAAAS